MFPVKLYPSADRTPTANMLDPLGIKPERDKTTPSHDRRDDDRPRSKDSAALSSRMTPHPVLPTVSASSSMHDDPSRGFQPYRPSAPGEEALRHVMASGGLPGIDPAAYSAAYAQAAAAAAALTGAYPPASPYAGVRLDDPILLERYRLMQSSVAGYPYTPSGFIAPPGSLSHYLGGPASRYPPELLSQMGYPYLYPGAKLPEHLSPGSAERLKSEEELRREREIEREREREKERERREKEERERAVEREREREREKERQIKEAERRHSTGSSSSGYAADRLLLGGGSSNNYPQPPPAHEPLNLKRGPDDDHHSHSSRHHPHHSTSSSSSASHHSDGHSHQRVPPAHSSSQRQLNGERDMDRHLSTYRPEGNSRSNVPTIGVPPLSVPKPHNLSSQNKESRESSHHSFHRPFEISSHNSNERGGRDHLGSSSIPAVTNGYDRDSYAEYERRLLMEREKMLAEHRAAQEKLQQQRTSSNSSSSHESHRSSHESDSGSKHRAGFSVHDSKDRIEHHRDRESSSGKSLNLSMSSSSSHHHQHLHSNHEKHSSSSLHKSPHKSLLSSSSSGNSSSSNNNNTKYASSASHHLQFPFTSNNMKASKDSNIHSLSESQTLPKQLHYSDSAKIASSHATYTSQSALTSLQNFSNSNVPSSFGSVIHSATGDSLDEQRKLKESGGILNHARLNGALQSHSRAHEASRIIGGDANKRNNNKMLNSVRSPKRMRPVLSSPGFVKEKLEDGEPAVKRLHLTDFDGPTERDPSSTQFNPDDLNREPDYRQKARFLFSLQLEPVSTEKRKDMEFCQKVCEWDKIRRQTMTDKPPSKQCTKEPPHVIPNQYCTDRLALLVKETLMNKKNYSTGSSISQPNNSTDLNASHLPSAVIPPASTTTTLNSSNNQPLQATRSVIYHQHPSSSSSTSSSLSEGKSLLSHHFAQEFHESVLKETQQQRANKGYKHENSNQDVRYTLISSDSALSQTANKHQQQQSTAMSNSNQIDVSHPLLPSSLQSMQNMTSQLLSTDSSISQAAAMTTQQAQMTSHHKAMTSPHGSQHSMISDIGEDNSTAVFKWPGVEAIMMAYQKHSEEVNAEKQILKEQCESLHIRNRHLNKTAEELSSRMAEFLKNKQKAEDERTKYQNDLDNLRKLLGALKR